MITPNRLLSCVKIEIKIECFFGHAFAASVERIDAEMKR